MESRSIGRREGFQTFGGRRPSPLFQNRNKSTQRIVWLQAIINFDDIQKIAISAGEPGAPGSVSATVVQIFDEVVLQ